MKIRYLGGGSKEFEYEPHLTSDGKIVGGLRIKSLKECDETGRVVSKLRYEYNNKQTGQSSGRCFAYPSATGVLDYRGNGFIPLQTKTWYLVYERYPFQLEDYNGAAIVYPVAQEIYANGIYKNLTFYSFDDYPDKKASVTIIGSDGSASDHARRDYRILPKTSYWWARGMIKSSELYNANGQQETKERFEYELGWNKYEIPDRIPFISMNGMVEYYMSSKNYTGVQYKLSTNYWISQSIKLARHYVEKGRINYASETHYSYDLDHNVANLTFSHDGKGNNQITTYIKYPFDYNLTNVTGGSAEVVALKKLQEKGLNL